MKIIHTLSLMLLIAIGGCREAAEGKKDIIHPSAITETDLDKIQLTDLKNRGIDIQQYKGKTVFVNFWATWCKPCIAEMPSIQKLQTRLKNENIIFLLASNEDVNEIEEFKNVKDYTFNYARIENFESQNIQAIPTTLIYNREGKLVFSEMGARNWDDSTSIEIILKIINQK
ncbi:MAG: TlpA disulfide reductase family protein [Bacteroidota bacterium]|nr:TlpA disulfide reductase family protein [Bacteroidota bacterium]